MRLTVIAGRQSGLREEQLAVFGEGTQQLGQCHERDRSENGAEHRTQATDHDVEQMPDRRPEAELIGVDEAHQPGVQAARDGAEEGVDGESQRLVARQVDAHDLGGVLVVANGHECAADFRLNQVLADPDHARGHHQRLAEGMRVPRGSRAGIERHAGAHHARRGRGRV